MSTPGLCDSRLCRVTTTQWARENGVQYSWRAALDNYEPTRDHAFGMLWQYDLPDSRGRGIVVEDSTWFRGNGRKCLFLVDDGTTIEPYYVAGWHPEGEHLILRPMPTDVDENGAQRLRPDGRPVDYATWALGPSTTYHLKVSMT